MDCQFLASHSKHSPAQFDKFLLKEILKLQIILPSQLLLRAMAQQLTDRQERIQA